MADEYAHVSKGKLKLKTDSEISKKKKKKKSKELKEQAMKSTDSDAVRDIKEVKRQDSKRPLTKAEQSFKQMQEKMQTKRIHEKASTTHKQRVEKFNEHLDSLTEHFDIPKVSWTK